MFVILGITSNLGPSRKFLAPAGFQLLLAVTVGIFCCDRSIKVNNCEFLNIIEFLTVRQQRVQPLKSIGKKERGQFFLPFISQR